MRTLIRKYVNWLLRPLGVEVRRVDSPRLFPPIYADTIKELLGALQELGVASLPADARRVPLMMELMGAKLSQSVYLLGSLQKAFAVAGDVCEFGVAAGATSALIANEMRETDKRLWLFDSFQGLPKPSEKDRLLDDVMGLGSIDKYEGAMSFPASAVRQRLREIEFPESRTEVVEGFVEQTLRQNRLPKQPLRQNRLPKRAAFSYVDMDFYEPIKLALEFLHTVTSQGGFIMVDDYGFLSEGAQTAVDEFLGAHEGAYEKVFPRPFAGHFIILRRG